MRPKQVWLPGIAALALLCAAGIAVLRLDPGVGRPPRRFHPQQATPQIVANYGKLPLSFEANQGQVDGQVKFLSRGQGYKLFLAGTEAVLQLQNGDSARNSQSAIRDPQLAGRQPKAESRQPAVLRMRLVGANPNAEVRGLAELPGKSNYFIGNDPSKWRTNVPTYGKVEYRDVYPGVSLVYYGKGRQLEHDFVVAPGGDPRVIRLAVEGAEKVELDAQGDLVLHASDGEVRFHKPVIYQEIDGARQEIAGGFVLRSPNPQSEIRNPQLSEVGFQVAAYDAAHPLVIDPVLVYSSYLGGNATEYGLGIAVDTAGNAYLTGKTTSSNFPTASALQTISGGGSADGFVTKLNASGSAIVYSTYIGGNGSEAFQGIAVDPFGNAYVTGATDSRNFPTAGALQASYGGGSTDAVVVKLNARGSALLYSTYLGGSGQDEGNDIAVDAVGSAYVTGYTASSNFPTANPLQAFYGGGISDGFVTKLNAAGSALVYSTYLGRAGEERGNRIVVDSSGNAYVAGYTSSSNSPAVNAVQSTLRGMYNGTVVKLNASGSALVYSTYLGGGAIDGCYGIAVDSAGKAYVTGYTSSNNFPTVSPLQAANGGGYDAFVTKLNATGSVLVFSTFLGGSGFEQGEAVGVDSAGNIYVSGVTGSSNFPTVNPVQSVYGGGIHDVFVVKLNAAGTALTFSSFLGGSGDDAYGPAMALDVSEDVYVGGYTSSTNFPTVNAFQATYGGGPYDAFITKLVTAPSRLAVSPEFLTFQAPQGSGAIVSQAVSISNAKVGALNWTAVGATSNGGDWLKLSATQGAAPASLTVGANPAGLPAGVYLGSIRIMEAAGGGTVTVLVALAVSPPATTILLSQSDFVFTTVESTPGLLKQTLRILNLGQGTLAWKLLATIPSGGNWLSIDQASGSTTTDPATAAPVGVLVNPAGLAAGNYYGLLIASSAGAANSPQLASVHLRVLPTTSAPMPSVLPSGFIFATSEGGAPPAAQAFSVQNLGGGALPLVATVSTAGGAPWLSASPLQATATGTVPATIAMQVSTGILRAGVYRGAISLDFPAGLTQDLSVILVITPAGVSPQTALERPAAGCPPTELQAVSTLLPHNFLSLVGWPVPIMVRVVDNCNNAITGATVVATFAGADYAPLLLKSLRDGLYSGTWVPLSNSRVRITIKVLSPPLKEATVELLSQPADFTANLPLINPDGVVNGASFAAKAPVAPGSIISLFGRNLVKQPEQAAAVPLPRSLAGLAVRIGDVNAPLFYANNGQVNVQVPMELSSNTAASAVITLEGKVSPPEPLLLSAVQPGIFTYDDGGTPRAAVLDDKYRLIGRSNPAAPGAVIQVFATGLGPTTPQVKTGEAAPTNPTAVLVPETQLTASIGGLPAEILFQGLAPGFVGLYQVNLRVPSGVASGDVPLVLTANGLRSNEAMLAVK